mmetsp:Transcript_13874/g.22991  ORF Transcript_13874/g.22991 Transcript_13874/m.22991 type:complete len:296 (-) Transcript_13874:117-1004(-)
MRAKVVGRVDLGQSHVAKGIAWDFFTSSLHFRHNLFDTRSFSEKDIDITKLVHDILQTSTLLGNIQRSFRDPNGVNIATVRGGGKTGDKLLQGESFAVGLGGSRRQVSGITTHALVQNEHARIGRGFGNDIFEKEGTLVGSRVGAKGLQDWVNVIVDSLGHANDNDLAAVFVQKVFGQVSGLGIGVVATDRVQDVDLVLHQLLGSNFEWSLVFLAQTTGNAILEVGKLDTRVSNRRSTQVVKSITLLPDILGEHKGVTNEDTLVPILVHADFEGGNLAVLESSRPILDKLCDRGR